MFRITSRPFKQKSRHVAAVAIGKPTVSRVRPKEEAPFCKSAAGANPRPAENPVRNGIDIFRFYAVTGAISISSKGLS